jgi:hypothetical protein
VAVIAIHAEIACMQLVAVRHRLYRRVAGHDHRGITDLHCHSDSTKCEETQHTGPDSYVLISRFRKDERH